MFQHPRSFPILVPVIATLAAMVVGCGAPSGDTDAKGSSTSAADTAADPSLRHLSLAGHQYGALPPQADVEITVDYGITRYANGGSSAINDVATTLIFGVTDPLAQPGDEYQIVLLDQVDFTSGETPTDKYVVALHADDASPTHYMAPLGAALENNSHATDGSSSAGLYVWGADSGEAIRVTQSLEVDKLFVDPASGKSNWVPLIEPLSNGHEFTMVMDRGDF